ncbi:HesA/MoeB/ThiF family protein [Porticoccus sp. W117]|uniref:HesA/MoeB/ThiF family protein n=1 Tax=Porticoccus sp. W117 TaxID=3054777 RepID=UPI00259957A5|nr:HesA/MoeB/ThiF family protein [Porticoccus sp. W117]MDM3871875.1 HesA/MoeB/ThiF family protein [Porticoccus sp. W117]
MSEALRYSRQQLLPEIGEQGQQALASARVLLVGAGGLGAPAALYLAGAGVGTLLIADGDTVDVSNLHRQVLYRRDDCGDSKSDSAQGQLETLNPHVNVESIDERLDDEALDYYVPEVDLVLDCSDNLTTRLAVNRACHRHSVPLVFGAAVGWDGQLVVFDFRDKGQLGGAKQPCYQCLFGDQLPTAQASCAEAGIIGPVVGILGTAMALEAIKLCVGVESKTLSQLQIFEGKSFAWRAISLSANPDCPVCA